MRNPLWVLTSSLALLWLLVLCVIFFTRKAPPARKSLTPSAAVAPAKKPFFPIDLSRIYNNDLFNTYKPPLKPIEPEKVNVVPPPPPIPLMPMPLPQPRIEFLEPLKISLKGIITSSDEQDNRAIIADEKTKKEEIYAVGGILEDAEIIRIERDKVIFIRSNGQQETLFLTAQDASEDPVFAHDTSWEKTVQKITDWSYAIDPDILKSKITSVAQFVDMLDMTTAFERDVSIGCHIGRMPDQSLGYALGLQTGDIVTHVNNMPLATTQERVTAYQSLKNATLGQTIRVRLLRQEKVHELVVILQHISSAKPLSLQSELPRAMEASSLAHLPPAAYEIQKRDQAAMRKFGSHEALLQRIPQK